MFMCKLQSVNLVKKTQSFNKTDSILEKHYLFIYWKLQF